MNVLVVGETWLEVTSHWKGAANHIDSHYGEGYQPLVNALLRTGHFVVHIPNHLAEREFPKTISEFRDYDVVILSDAPADSLQLTQAVTADARPGPDPLRALETWVRGDAGALLMIGGYLSFSGFAGNGCYSHTPIADALPVELLGYDDRVERPAGVEVEVADGVWCKGLDTLGPFPALLGYNKLVAKAGSHIDLTIGSDPLLTLWQYGSGRTAAFASDCSPHWGSREFMDWQGYHRLWDLVISWLCSG